jgi:hypothetical protein
VKGAHNPGEALGGDPSAPLGAEDLVVNCFLALALRLSQLLPEPTAAAIGKGRGGRQQLAVKQGSVAVGPKASGQDPLEQRFRRATHCGGNWQKPKPLHRTLFQSEFCQQRPKCERGRRDLEAWLPSKIWTPGGAGSGMLWRADARPVEGRVTGVGYVIKS